MKDYWIKAYREFFALGVFAVLLSIAVWFAWVSEVKLIKDFGLILPIQGSVMAILWVVLGLAFKKRKKWSVPLGYTLISLLFLSSLYSFNIIFLLITLYYLWVIYKAQKQEVVPIQPTNAGQ